MDRFTTWVYSVMYPAPMQKQAKGPDALAMWMRKQACISKTANSIENLSTATSDSTVNNPMLADALRNLSANNNNYRTVPSLTGHSLMTDTVNELNRQDAERNIAEKRQQAAAKAKAQRSLAAVGPVDEEKKRKHAELSPSELQRKQQLDADTSTVDSTNEYVQRVLDQQPPGYLPSRKQRQLGYKPLGDLQPSLSLQQKQPESVEQHMGYKPIWLDSARLDNSWRDAGFEDGLEALSYYKQNAVKHPELHNSLPKDFRELIDNYVKSDERNPETDAALNEYLDRYYSTGGHGKDWTDYSNDFMFLAGVKDSAKTLRTLNPDDAMHYDKHTGYQTESSNVDAMWRNTGFAEIADKLLPSDVAKFHNSFAAGQQYAASFDPQNQAYDESLRSYRRGKGLMRANKSQQEDQSLVKEYNEFARDFKKIADKPERWFYLCGYMNTRRDNVTGLLAVDAIPKSFVGHLLKAPMNLVGLIPGVHKYVSVPFNNEVNRQEQLARAYIGEDTAASNLLYAANTGARAVGEYLTMRAGGYDIPGKVLGYGFSKIPYIGRTVPFITRGVDALQHTGKLGSWTAAGLRAAPSVFGLALQDRIVGPEERLAESIWDTTKGMGPVALGLDVNGPLFNFLGNNARDLAYLNLGKDTRKIQEYHAERVKEEANAIVADYWMKTGTILPDDIAEQQAFDMLSRQWTDIVMNDMDRELSKLKERLEAGKIDDERFEREAQQIYINYGRKDPTMLNMQTFMNAVPEEYQEKTLGAIETITAGSMSGVGAGGALLGAFNGDPADSIINTATDNKNWKQFVANDFVGYLRAYANGTTPAHGRGSNNVLKVFNAMSQEDANYAVEYALSKFSGYDLISALKTISGASGDGPIDYSNTLLGNRKFYNAVSTYVSNHIGDNEYMADLLDAYTDFNTASGGGLPPEWNAMIANNLEKLDIEGIFASQTSDQWRNFGQWAMAMSNKDGGNGLANLFGGGKQGKERADRLVELITEKYKAECWKRAKEDPWHNLPALLGMAITKLGAGGLGKYVGDNPLATWCAVASLLGLGATVAFGGGGDTIIYPEQQQMHGYGQPTQIPQELGYASPGIDYSKLTRSTQGLY